MAKINAKIIYEKDEDILYLSKSKIARASIEIGDFIIDIDMKGYVSAIEILNASENLKISPKILENIERASMSVVYKPHYIYVTVIFRLREREKDISIPLTIDLGHKKTQKEEIVFVR